MMLKRKVNWPELLAQFIDSRRFKPFSFGENDCCLFAADAVLEMTGTDLAADRRGYSTEREAISLIRNAGGMRELLRGLREKNSGFASRGDIVMVAIEGRETLGIVCGNGHWCGPGADALIFRPMIEVQKVFGI